MTSSLEDMCTAKCSDDSIFYEGFMSSVPDGNNYGAFPLHGTARYGTVHFWGVFHWVLYLVPDTVSHKSEYTPHISANQLSIYFQVTIL